MAFTIADGAAKLSRKLPRGTLNCVSKALIELQDGLTRDEIVQRVSLAVSSPAARASVTKFVKKWRKRAPDVSAEAVAYAIMAATAATTQLRAMQSEELVWSGPRPQGTTLRRIDAALHELIDRAEKTLTIVTFAAYDIPKIRERLISALDRGVAVTLILESKELSEGALKVGPLLALGKEITQRSRVLIWPPDKRPKGEDAKPGVLHAKCAIADERRMLVSSANLTGSAMESNMELGLVITGGALPREVVHHLTALEVGGQLVIGGAAPMLGGTP